MQRKIAIRKNIHSPTDLYLRYIATGLQTVACSNDAYAKAATIFAVLDQTCSLIVCVLPYHYNHKLHHHHHCCCSVQICVVCNKMFIVRVLRVNPINIG